MIEFLLTYKYSFSFWKKTYKYSYVRERSNRGRKGGEWREQ